MTGRLISKVCIVTGTGGSMGREAARMFAAQGALVVGCDIDPSRAAETLALVTRAGGRMTSLHPVDLSLQSGAKALINFAIAEFGRIDVLYNNGAAAEFAWLPDMSGDQWNFTLRNEMDVIFHTVQAVWPHMLAGGGGSIINVGSVSGKIAYQVLPALAHSAAKGGVIAMTKHLAMEGGPHAIRANSISPGLILSDAVRALMRDPAWEGPMLNKIMLGRPGEPEDVVQAAIYLASDESRWVTGADFAIDGGTTAW
ncbi:SDR family NAD(P)-dependent oxidoreductase [Aquisediminimonas profunda]|uniref:SDR family NAD(P)-dependent oxidoreductase n=1 Tax=Aquisediminimonas profunda TaxID=1550733 RepID=UPI001C62525A|nr:SDR family NAD(P)-dependent oxidoreductase [Aquisediminimonas profunda]